MLCLRSKNYTKLKITTWVNQGNSNLLDYTSPQIVKTKHELHQSSIIQASSADNQILIYESNSNHKHNDSYQNTEILSIEIQKDGKYQKNCIFHPLLKISSLQKRRINIDDKTYQPYLVVKYYKQFNNKLGYPLKINDVFKLGQSVFRVTQISGVVSQSYVHPQDSQKSVAKNQQKGTCKFCLCDEETEINPIISPCKCKGSCSGVHIQCLKQWITNKANNQVQGLVRSLNFSKLSCQICKHKFSQSFSYNGRQVSLLSFEKPQGNYLIFQTINSAKKVKDQKCMHIIFPKQGQSVTIGRGEQPHIKITDKTVSRMHSSIKLKNGQFYLKDKDSKFGTLVQVNQSMNLQSKTIFQIRNYLFQITPPY